MAMSSHVLLALVCFTLVGGVASTKDSFLCYSCQTTDPTHPGGQECISEPWNYTVASNIVPCSTNQKCFARRQWDKGNDRLYYFQRGCADVGTYEDKCSQDFYYETCVQLCTGNMCNDVNGTFTGYAPVPSTTTATPTTTSAPVPQCPSDRPMRCYSCVTSTPTTDEENRCVLNPATMQGHNTACCASTWHCQTVRQYDHGIGVIRNFNRGCTPQPGQEGCVLDYPWETCSRYCQGELCNSLDGTLTSPASDAGQQGEGKGTIDQQKQEPQKNRPLGTESLKQDKPLTLQN